MATVNRQRISNAAGGLGDPLQNLAPQPIVSVRNPATSDVAEIGTVWINKATDAYFVLTSVVAGAAVWTAQATGSGTFASVTVTGGAGTVLTVDAAGDTDLGGNLAVAGDTTMTGNLAVTGDLTVTGDFDITSAAALSFTTTSDTDPAISFTANGGTSETIIITASQGTAADSIELTSTAGGVLIQGGLATADAVNIASTNGAGGIDIDSGTGGIALDSTGAFSIDGATASNVTVTGAAQDLTLAAVGGSVNITATQSAADSIKIESTLGGIDILASGAVAGEDIDIIATGSSVNIESTEDAALAVYLHANGGTSETIRIRSDLGTGVASIDILSDVGGITLTSGLASADAINLAASAGGVDVDGALQVNIASSQAAVADSIRIVASAADGGIDVDAGTGGITIDSTGAISIDAAAASNFTVTGAGLDLTLASAGGSVAISSTENAASAIGLTANGGTSETIVVTSSQGTGAASIALTSTAGGITLTGGLATADAINIVASNAAGGIDVDAGTGGMSFVAANGAIAVASGTGAINISADAAATTVNVGTGAAVKTVTVGSTNTTSTTLIQAGSGLITLGGTVALNTAAGPQILAGTGSPDTAVTAPIGSLFLRTDPAGATSRAYINTDGATAWVNFTMAA